VDAFKRDIEMSTVLNDSLKYLDIEELVATYNTELSLVIEKHAPLRTKIITIRPTCPWYTEELHEAKHLRRKLERKWRVTRLTIDHDIYRH
jgi:hypothetical protein